MNKNRFPKHVRKLVADALKHATMETASFGFTTETVTVRGFDGSERTITKDEFIKEETRSFRQSWIIPQLEAVLKWADGDDNAAKGW